jgi:sugar-specific transcriptional regulator TrmB
MSPPNKAGSRKASRAQDDTFTAGLRDLGLTEYEVRVFLAILRHPLSRIPAIAKLADVPQPKVYATVKRLIGRGLCESHLGAVNTYSAVAPESGFAPLLEELKEKHAGACGVVQDLEREHAVSADPLAAREGRIKLFQGRQSATRNFHYLLSNVERDVVLIAQRPFVIQDDDKLLASAMERGARARILVGIPDDFDVHAEPLLERQLALGCESRRMSEVPMRMAVFDEKVALMPIHETHEAGAEIMMLEVRNEVLAMGLLNIFELLWDQAQPIE